MSCLWPLTHRGGVDYCEDHRDEVYALAVKGTKNLVGTGVRCGAKIIYYPADYIFDGKAGPYSEDDQALSAQRLRTDEVGSR